jgi:hypothetical protein
MSQYSFPPVVLSSVSVSGTVAVSAIAGALPAGTNSIGTVILGAGTAAFGKLSANSGVDIGDVDVTSLPALPAGTNSIGTVILGAGTAAFGKLSANSGVDIGDVDVTSLPSIPAGTNSIGTVILGTGSAVFGKLAANSGVDIGDVTLNAGTAEIGKLAAGTASIGSVTLNANSGVDIGDVDITSVVPGVGATNLGKAIQSAQGTTDTGVPALVVRNDTLADLAGSDHDYAPLQVNATGALYTDVTNIIPGTGATNLGKAIQSAQGTTDTGVPALVVRNDTLADLSGADGDYAPLQVNASGALYTALAAGTASIGTVILGTGSAQIGKLAANSGVDIGDVDVTSLPSLPAGSNNIGDVDIASALPAGTNSIGTVVVGSVAPVDFLDDGVMDTSTDNIASTGTIVVASTLAAACTEIEVVDDIGEYMSIAEGTTKKAYLPLGGGRVKVALGTGSPIRLYSETGTAISSGKIAINFLG